MGIGRHGRRDHHRDLVVLPRDDVDHVPVGEELHDRGLVDAEVRARVLGGLGTGVTGYPQDFADLDIRVLSDLAE